MSASRAAAARRMRNACPHELLNELVTLLIGVKLANELAAAEQAMS
jgi:hypothetical protein